MCKCVDIAMGSYDNTILLGWHPTMHKCRDNRAKVGLSDDGICVDRCIAEEVYDLWEAGIRTYGSCCGHNKIDGMINVGPEDFAKAIALGYEKYEFANDPGREDTIRPKSVDRFSQLPE